MLKVGDADFTVRYVIPAEKTKFLTGSISKLIEERLTEDSLSFKEPNANSEEEAKLRRPHEHERQHGNREDEHDATHHEQCDEVLPALARREGQTFTARAEGRQKGHRRELALARASRRAPVEGEGRAAAAEERL